jgi:hypothetical protein
MQHLIKSVSVNVGSFSASYKICQKCGQPFQLDEDKEFEVVKRQLCNGKGNLKLCWDCDKVKTK